MPARAPKVPPGHATGLLDAFGQKKAGGQMLHAVAPLFSWYVPSTHHSQREALGRALYAPGAHVDGSNVPIGHAVPAGQPRHCSSAKVVTSSGSWRVPAGQSSESRLKHSRMSLLASRIGALTRLVSAAKLLLSVEEEEESVVEESVVVAEESVVVAVESVVVAESGVEGLVCRPRRAALMATETLCTCSLTSRSSLLTDARGSGGGDGGGSGGGYGGFSSGGSGRGRGDRGRTNDCDGRGSANTGGGDGNSFGRGTASNERRSGGCGCGDRKGGRGLVISVGGDVRARMCGGDGKESGGEGGGGGREAAGAMMAVMRSANRARTFVLSSGETRCALQWAPPSMDPTTQVQQPQPARSRAS